ncbi:DsbA family oxidoreductase [Lacisediminimonas profundi]|uniref:DsbA family oxidoreductase n=1 Tax=Lacisediminimonas profundi TaxID=2603856 RepID=UPI00124AF959|nr:DsbA family oxidoreductase [Lacisediminimonas profundi]
MTVTLKIDFVSDVACPWCAVGLNALQRALERLDGEVQAELHFQPFELNPDMAPEGQDTMEHLTQKYGASEEQMQANQKVIAERGAEVGFRFNLDRRTRVYNTFDAHRLLHWAESEGRQAALKQGLLKAYFTDGRDPSSHEVLASVAREAGLDENRARAILASDEHAQEVRERERLYLGLGINSVPSVIVNDRHLIQGGQPVDVFEQALRQLAADYSQAASN